MTRAEPTSNRVSRVVPTTTDNARQGTEWMRQAACAGDWDFTERGLDEQLAVCSGCPVALACLEFGINGPMVSNADSDFSPIVYGGVHPRQLHQMQRFRRSETEERPTPPTRDTSRQWSHCPRGHQLHWANTYVRPGDGKRECITCRRRRRADRTAQGS